MSYIFIEYVCLLVGCNRRATGFASLADLEYSHHDHADCTISSTPSQPHEHSLIQIFVQPALGACIVVSVPQHATVRDIQAAASDCAGVPSSAQTITLNGKPLTGDTPISALSISCGSSFRLHARLAGGADRDGEVKQSEVARLSAAAPTAPATAAPPPIPTPSPQAVAALDASTLELVRVHRPECRCCCVCLPVYCTRRSQSLNPALFHILKAC